MTGLTIEGARRAKKAARAAKREADPYSPAYDRRLLREYSQKTRSQKVQTVSTADAVADPVRVDHDKRRDVLIAPLSFDVEPDGYPSPLTQCGCGECPEVADPRVGSEHPFADIYEDEYGSLSADSICSEPMPTTLRKARVAYLRVQKADHESDADNRTSLCQKTAIKHGKILGAERQLLEQEFGTDATCILFSFRISPVDYEDGERVWVPPVTLDNDLHKSWSNITSTLSYQIGDKLGLDYEYIAITSTTTIAATPHTHMVVLVDDPDDEVGIDAAESVVDSHVNNCPRAYEDHHPVEEGQSDAGRLHHDPPISTYTESEREGRGFGERMETVQKINSHQDTFNFPNTQAMEYAANQRPHWVLKNVYDGETDIHRDSVLVDGGAVAWARQHNWVKSSSGMDLQNGTVDR